MICSHGFAENEFLWLVETKTVDTNKKWLNHISDCDSMMSGNLDQLFDLF